MTESPLNIYCFGKHPMYNKQFITLIVQYGGGISLSHLYFHSPEVLCALEISPHIVR